MDAESFFSRWSRNKAQAPEATATDPETAGNTAPQPPSPPPPPPTLDDVAGLTSESDFTRFVARGVDEDVRRSAMKKLFTDPHFNIMDGLDIYIDDYSKPDPIPAAMLAMMNHAQTLLNPMAQFDNPLMRLLDKAEAETPVVRQEAGMVSDDAGQPALQQAGLDAEPLAGHDEGGSIDSSDSHPDNDIKHTPTAPLP